MKNSVVQQYNLVACDQSFYQSKYQQIGGIRNHEKKKQEFYVSKLN